ncbi:MAG: MerC domain-containing protein [Planctomycetes bacterium]|nr:MerC domain-containing protein [Planctomycetota bacterium]
MRRPRVPGSLDLVGALLSGACAVHCAATPLLLTAAASYHDEESPLELGLQVAAVTLAGGAAAFGYLDHRRRGPLLLVLAGAAAIALAHRLGAWTPWVLGLGGLCLAGAHLLNRRLSRACCGEDEITHEHAAADPPVA